MDVNKVIELAAELSKMGLNDEQELLTFLPLAARLAALGDRSQMARWPTAVKKLGCDIRQLLIDRCGEGDWELGEASGEDLGLSIIAAQDFACLLQLEGDLLPADARASIEAWIEVAEEAPLDAGAVKLLETFLDCFPLPEEYRLGIVDSPLTQAERALVVRGLPSPPVVEVTLRTAAAVMPELQLAYAGAAPSSLISSFELTDEAVDAGPAGCFTLSRRLHEDWRVVVDLLALGGESAAARAMRLGTFPGSRGSDEEPWVVNLSHAPIAERIAALGRPLFFQLRDGTRLRIVCLPKDSHRA